MLKKTIEWILGTVTLVLVLAVVFVYFFHSDDKEESIAFLPANDAADHLSIDNSDIKAMADIESIKLDTLSDIYKNNYNRSLNGLSDSLEINFNDQKHNNVKDEFGEDLIIELGRKIVNIGTVTDYVADVSEQPVVAETPVEVWDQTAAQDETISESWYEPEVSIEVPAERSLQTEVPAEPTIQTEVPAETEAPTEPIIETEAPTEPIIETEAPTESIVQTEASAEPPGAPAGQSIQFVSPGSSSAAAVNHSLIAGLIKPNGKASYYNFTENGDGTITVDGYTFAYTSTNYSTITGYDGIESHDTGTASGLRTTRGLVATVMPEFGGYPFGTVLFIEGYGLVVVADYNGMGAVDSSWLDVCYYDNELASGIDPGRTTSRVFVLATN